jgi:hypothetical protein
MKISLFVFLSLLCTVSLKAVSLIMVTQQDAKQIKQRVQSGAPQFKTAASIWKAEAEKALKQGPWTVTAHHPPIKISPHDYYSEAPYYWPAPDEPTRFIRRDGQRNPKRFQDDHRDLDDVNRAVLSLGLAAYMFDDARYAQHAADIIAVWFENPETRMNPNLQHAQAIPGQKDGRGTGIIDTVGLIRCVQGMALLRLSGKWEASHAEAAANWFAEYMKWLTTSARGQQESVSGNNHETWWTAQAAAYASFAGDNQQLGKLWEKYRRDLLKQIQPDGSCPRELARTNSLSYSCYNMDAFATLCQIASTNGVDLWHYDPQSATPLSKAFQFLAPFLANPSDWHHQQISTFNPNGLIFPGLAGVALPSRELLTEYEKFQHPNDSWSQWIWAVSTLHN